MSKHRSSQRKRLSVRFGTYNCHYCDCETIPNNKGDHYSYPNSRTLDHIVPKCMGGRYMVGNLVIACGKCNTELGDKYLKCFCLHCEAARAVFEWVAINTAHGVAIGQTGLYAVYNATHTALAGLAA